MLVNEANQSKANATAFNKIEIYFVDINENNINNQVGLELC